MKQDSNCEFKERREVKVIENEHIVLQNLVLVLLWTYFAQCLPVFIIEFGQVNTGWKG